MSLPDSTVTRDLTLQKHGEGFQHLREKTPYYAWGLYAMSVDFFWVLPTNENLQCDGGSTESITHIIYGLKVR